jgi:hypothetical protein
LSVELETLYELQELDLRLLEKQREVDKYEKALAERQAAISACDARIADLAAKRKQLVNQRAFAERRVSDSQEQLKERRQRATRVRTEGELRANEREIGAMQREIEEQEEALLQIMQQVDDVEAAIEAVRAEQTDHREADHRQIEEEASRIDVLKSEVAAQRDERNQLASALDATLRKRYDLVLDRRGGRAVVTVINGSCQGCHMQIPPQIIIEVMRTRAVRVCPQCQRIIYLPEE